MKRNKPLPRSANAVALVLGVLLAAGCTHTIKIKVAPTANIQNPSATKIPLHVALMLDERFCNYSHKFENMGDTWVHPFGPALRQQSTSLCEQTFKQVTVSTNGVVPPGVDAVLTPEVHRSGYAVGLGNKFMFTMLVQWELRDRENRNVLWMATVDGQSADKQKRVFQKLFNDLNAKSYRAFQDSAEIKRMAANLK
jgi:hypothetical protein